MGGPYREAVVAETLEVPTREGLVKLDIGPRFVSLQVGDAWALSVSERFATVSRHLARKRPKKRSLKLEDARLLVARDRPTDDVGIWHEATPGMVHRLFGLRKHGLDSDEDIEDEQRKLEALIQRLQRALAIHSGGVKRSLEIGTGADKVLIMDFGEHLLFHVRRLFQERQRSAFEVHRDGTIAVLQQGIFVPPHSARLRTRLRRQPHRFRSTFRFGVSVGGDYIRFVDQNGEDLGNISLPWISSEDRAEMAKLITGYIDYET